jgi:hypothetical protein
VGRIIAARAFANNEIIYIAWKVDEAIPGCRGFDIKRIDSKTGSSTSLPAWVPFDGQRNEGWKSRDTSVWPVQRFSWKDLTWRDELDKIRPPTSVLENPDLAHALTYRIIPLIGPADALKPHVELGLTTNSISLANEFGEFSVAVNSGILSTQWLTNTLKQQYGAAKPLSALKTAIAKPTSPIRKKLAGDALPFLRRLLDRAAASGGSVLLALYELTDPELCPLLLANKDRVRIILSNTSSDKFNYQAHY